MGSDERPARPDPGLVRRARPRPPLARTRRHPVGRDGLGVHAPADAGRPGAARLRELDDHLADARDLAAAPSGEAVRAWGRLGYPRRALRLHAAATAIVDRHDGEVPSAWDDLIALPGVGDYTASAVASFAFGARHAVLDTNVRRVLARAVGGVEFPATSVTKAERVLAGSLVPDEQPATWAVAVMELGALVCTAARPRCEACPVADRCAWTLAGRPAYDGPPRRGQAWAGTDRQVRGRLMAVLREAEGSVARGPARRGLDRTGPARPRPAEPARRRPGRPRPRRPLRPAQLIRRDVPDESPRRRRDVADEIHLRRLGGVLAFR